MAVEVEPVDLKPKRGFVRGLFAFAGSKHIRKTRTVTSSSPCRFYGYSPLQGKPYDSVRETEQGQESAHLGQFETTTGKSRVIGNPVPIKAFTLRI